jgi:cytochrome c oxidase assembly factor CtaG
MYNIIFMQNSKERIRKIYTYGMCVLLICYFMVALGFWLRIKFGRVYPETRPAHVFCVAACIFLHRCVILYFAVPLAMSNYSLIKNVISWTKTCLTDQHLEGGMRIAATEIKTVIERLLKQKQCPLSR